jgi:hypothetical protein
MNRALWLIFGAAAVGVAVLPLKDGDERVNPPNPPAERLPDVRIRQEFVTVPLPSPVTGPASNRTRVAHLSPRITPADITDTEDEQIPLSRTGTRPARRAARDATFFQRATRAFIGDGRHRPEPFPRPRGNN